MAEWRAKRRRIEDSPSAPFERAYYTVGAPSSFGGIKPFLAAISTQRREAQQWLHTQDVYELYRPARRRYPRNPIRSLDIDDVWEADLMEFKNIARYNDGNRYILTVIDVFSKQVHMTPLPRKMAQYTAAVLDELFVVRHPNVLRTDAGTEWVNRQVRDVLHRFGVHHVPSNDKHHVPVVERFHRTFREQLSRYFHHANTLRYIEFIPSFIDAYHHRYHRAIGMAPAAIQSDEARDQVYERLYHRYHAALVNAAAPSSGLAVGDRVRVSLVKESALVKTSDQPKWSEAVYTVASVHRAGLAVPMYSLRNEQGELLKGWFYADELQRTLKGDDDLFRVERVLGRKRIRGREHLLVQWSGHPRSAASYVPAENVYKL